MTPTSADPLLRFIRRLAEPVRFRDRTDAQLLQQFVATRDEAAFAALVQRRAVISAQAVALADAVTKVLLMAKVKLATASLLTASVLAGTARVVAHQALGTGPVTASSPSKTRRHIAMFVPVAVRNQAELQPESADAQKNENLVFSGRVLDPDGKPFAGAKLHMTTASGYPHQPLSDQLGAPASDVWQN